MKTKKRFFAGIRLLLSGVLTAAAVLALAACPPATGPEVSSKGVVNIRLGIDGSPPDPARTLLPGSVDPAIFSSYNLVFTPSEGAQVIFNGLTDLSGIVLNTGTYSLALTAYTLSGEEAAAGSATGIIVTTGATEEVTVPLVFKPGAGDGTLSFTITRPLGLSLSAAKFTLIPLYAGGTIPDTADWLAGLLANTNLSDTKTIASGYYDAVVTLSTPERRAVKSDTVHIGAGQTTTLNWTFETGNFSTTVEDIWLLGVDDQWQTYDAGNKLTQEPNGTFVWEGTMSQGFFWFSLDDTSEWQDDKDKPNRFQPAADGTVITLGTPAPMIFVPRNTGSTAAWNLGGAGYYRFIVDPAAETVVVTARVLLSAPQNVNLSATGAASWNASADETNVVKYSVQLYKNGASEGLAREVATGGSYLVDFLSAMRGGGAGSYTVKVKAIGDGVDYSDSPEAESGTQTVSQRSSVPNTWWDASDVTTAHWDTVSGSGNATDYTVNVYKGETKVTATTGTGIYNTPAKAYVDLVSAMEAYGTGIYKFGVITKGDNALILDSGETVVSASYSFIAALAAPGKPGLTGGAVTWTAVSGADSYTVKLYKGGTSEAVGTYTNQTSGDSVLSAMRSSGAGSYTSTVQAIGDGINWLSSAESAPSDAETVSVLSTPGSLAWNNTSAEWTGDANAVSYTVKLYKGAILVNTVSNAVSPLNLEDSLTSAGTYTFMVQAIGAGLYLDSNVSAASAAKQVGGTADITFEALEGWTGVLGVAGEETPSIAKSSGSLTIEVTGSGFTAFVWIVDGDALLGETGSSITLSGTNYSLGGHSVTVYAYDGSNVPWSPENPIEFTVTAQ